MDEVFGRSDVIERGVSGPGHGRGGDLDEDHLDQELDAGIDQVAGVAVGSAFLQPERDVDVRQDAPGLMVLGDGAAAERFGVGEMHFGPDRSVWVVELARTSQTWRGYL